MQPIYVALITSAAVVIGGLLTYLVSKQKLRSDSGMQMIDQHQEDIKELRTERAKDSERITRLERAQRIQGDYIGQLRKHIVDGRPPPPPPYPDGLIT